MDGWTTNHILATWQAMFQMLYWFICLSSLSCEVGINYYSFVAEEPSETQRSCLACLRPHGCKWQGQNAIKEVIPVPVSTLSLFIPYNWPWSSISSRLLFPDLPRFNFLWYSSNWPNYCISKSSLYAKENFYFALFNACIIINYSYCWCQRALN